MSTRQQLQPSQRVNEWSLDFSRGQHDSLNSTGDAALSSRHLQSYPHSSRSWSKLAPASNPPSEHSELGLPDITNLYRGSSYGSPEKSNSLKDRQSKKPIYPWMSSPLPNSSIPAFSSPKLASSSSNIDLQFSFKHADHASDAGGMEDPFGFIAAERQIRSLRSRSTANASMRPPIGTPSRNPRASMSRNSSLPGSVIRRPKPKIKPVSQRQLLYTPRMRGTMSIFTIVSPLSSLPSPTTVSSPSSSQVNGARPREMKRTRKKRQATSSRPTRDKKKSTLKSCVTSKRKATRKPQPKEDSDDEDEDLPSYIENSLDDIQMEQRQTRIEHYKKVDEYHLRIENVYII